MSDEDILQDPSEYTDAYARVDELLAQLVQRTEVRLGMLVNHNGLCLSSQGDATSFIEDSGLRAGATLESIGTLIANNASATAALAKFLGEDTFGEQMLHGRHGTLYVESVGTNALLTLVFDRSIPIGRVKVAAREAVRAINKLLEHINTLPTPGLHPNFAEGASNLIDDLLSLGTE